MKIEINIDIEAIVREEIRNYIRENIVINSVKTSADVATISAILEEDKSATSTEEFVGKYAKVPNKRRSKLEIAFNEKEIELGRYLTPEEEGEIEATMEYELEKKAQARDTAKKKAHYQEIAEEVTAEVHQEPLQAAEDEIEDSPSDITTAISQELTDAAKSPGYSIPEIDDLDNVNKLFA